MFIVKRPICNYFLHHFLKVNRRQINHYFPKHLLKEFPVPQGNGEVKMNSIQSISSRTHNL